MKLVLIIHCKRIPFAGIKTLNTIMDIDSNVVVETKTTGAETHLITLF
ncbi:MAG: hypothetical protein BTN85_0752 [Candidatus Methanohalarchaeum thermophilum]|uniref:Uncharacterized protein n=1 Tax=Methanohalarchaeum thermophilum TaxID=1903181 RepID=A0A1Q6DV83_METT1|nr:MAG: hypothetical protein BTN85_0752 [Candidatus Methanohalarchaeum thermophilum]